MGTKIGSSDSRKQSYVHDPSYAGGDAFNCSAQADSNPLFSTELPPLDTNHRVYRFECQQFD